MHSHRSILKQTNKPFKGGSSGRKDVGGRVLGPRAPVKSIAGVAAQGRKERALAAKQQRNKRREEVRAKRRIGAMSPDAIPPKVVMMLPFKSGVDITELKNALTNFGVQPFVGEVSLSDVSSSGKEDVKSVTCQPVTFQLPPWAQMSVTGEGKKQRVTLIDSSPYLYPTPDPLPRPSAPKKSHPSEEEEQPVTQFLSKQALQTVLDIAKTANIILCVFSGTASLDDPAFDDLGYEMLSALKLQGLPSPIGVMVRDAHYDSLDAGKQKDQRRLVQRYFTSEFGNDKKFICAETDEDLKSVLRSLSNVAPKEFSWRSIRGFIIPDRVEIQQDRLIVEGYARGLGFTVKSE